MADTALKTANSGYLTRRLCDVAQDVQITKAACDPKKRSSVTISEIIEGEIFWSVYPKSIGRVIAENIKIQSLEKLLLKKIN